MRVTDTEQFLYYRVEALENELNRVKTENAILLDENINLKKMIINNKIR